MYIRIRGIIPFIAVFIMLFGSIAVSCIVRNGTSKATVSVNTGPDEDGTVCTMRIMQSISSVMVINRQKTAQRTVLKNDQWLYDPQTTQITFTQPLPYPQPVIHIEGVPVQPETWILRNFSGTADELLVLLDGREANADFDYTFDAQNSMLVFRKDIHPEDGNYCIQYPAKTAASKGVRCFSNWKKKDWDTLAELQAEHAQKLHGGPLVVVKNRAGSSHRQLRKESGIDFSLPDTDSIFLIETVENGTKHISIHCEYGDLAVECSAKEPLESADAQKQLFMQNPAVFRQYTAGVTGTPEKQLQTEFILYTWNKKGVYYQLAARQDQQKQAESLLEKCTRMLK